MAYVVENLKKQFGQPPTDVLKGLNFTVDDGEFVAVTGRSGSGKSTLLYILSTLDSASSGRLILEGREVTSMSEEELHTFRNEKMGFVFQFHYLLPELTALENVLMPTRKLKLEKSKEEEAINLLKEVGLESKLHRFPSQLSGGEQQRVAIARCLIMRPKYIFADEPTGNLDSVNGMAVIKLFQKINQERKTTILYVTHDQEFASMASRQIHLVDGRLA